MRIYEDPGVATIIGDPDRAADAEGSFGRDHTTVTNSPDAPAAYWSITNQAAGTYRIAITWDGDAGLYANAVAQAVIYDAQGYVTWSGALRTANQKVDPFDFWLDDQGVRRGWLDLGATAPVPQGGRIDVGLIGQAGTPLRVDALMIQRVVETSYSYDGNGNLLSATAPLTTDGVTRTTTYQYDELGRRIKTTLPDPDGATGAGGPGGSNLQSPVVDYFYDGYGNVVKTIERRGTATDRTSVMSYDKRNRLILETESFGTTDVVSTKYEYDDASNLKRLLEAFGSIDEVVTQFGYDNLNRLKERIDDAGSVGSPNARTAVGYRSTYKYDSVGNLIRSESITTDPTATQYSAIAVTVYAFDDVNRLVQTVGDFGEDAHHVNATTQYAYDAAGNVLHITDPTGSVTAYGYDRLNRLTSTTRPASTGVTAGPTESFGYDMLGNVVRRTNAEDESTYSIYDARGRQIASIDDLGFETRYRYDAVGNLLEVVDPQPNSTVYAYDALNRVKTDVILNDQAVPLQRSYIYSDAGTLDRSIDRNGRVIKYGYDILDRLISEQWFADATDPTADTTLAWTYDKLDRVRTSGQREATNGALVYEEAFDYDNLGRILKQENFNSVDRANPRVRQLYQYDIINPGDAASLVRVKYTQAKEDSVGGAFTADAIATYSFDRLGRMVKIDDQAMSSNVGTNTTAIVGKSIAFAYDAAGRMTATQRSASFFRLDTSFAYDGMGRLTSVAHTRANQSAAFIQYGLEYDNASRVTSRRTVVDPAVAAFGVTTASRIESYAYDDVGQLTSRDLNAAAGVEDSFVYDGNGNRTSANGVGSTTGKNNRVTNDGAFTYEYDKEGNLKKRTRISDGYVTEYEWDHRNRLIDVKERVAAAGAVVKQISYNYNADDMRVGKVLRVDQGSGLTLVDAETYVYDGGQLAMTLDRGLVAGQPDTTGHVQNRYLNGPGVDELLVDEYFGGRGNPGVGTYNLRWAATDQQGSVRDLLDQSNSVVEHRDFDAYGNVTAIRNQSGALELTNGSPNLAALDSAFGFVGRELDVDSGLHYNRARWYDAKLGKFISADPIGFAGGDANLYRYAGNDPINSSDPTGLWETNSHAYSGFNSLNLNSSPSSGFSFNTSELGGVGFGLDELASNIAAQNSQRTQDTRSMLLSALTSRLGQSASPGSESSSRRPPLLSTLLTQGNGGQAAANREAVDFTFLGRSYVWPNHPDASWNPLKGVFASAANQIAGKVGGFLIGVNTPIDAASGLDLAAAAGKGTAQGVANSINGVQDAVIGIGNIPSAVTNAGLYFAGSNSRAPYIPSPDWSEGLITQESTHDTSKFLGGHGLVTLGTLGLSQLGAPGQAANLGHVTSKAGATGIAADGAIVSNTGKAVFALSNPSSSAATNWLRTLGAKVGAAVQLPASASKLFGPIPAVGPISTWTRLAGGYIAPFSSVSLVGANPVSASLASFAKPYLVDMALATGIQFFSQTYSGTINPGLYSDQ